MLSMLLVTLAAAALSAPPADARTSWDFEPLPAAPDGVTSMSPIAIANDGSVLAWIPATDFRPRHVLSRNGRLEAFELDAGPLLDRPIVTLTDLNTRGEIVGNNWWLRAPYSGYVGRAFILDPRGGLERIVSPVESSGLNSINEHGVAAGFVLDCPPDICFCLFEWCTPPEIRTAMVVADGVAVPLTLPDARPYESSMAVAIDDAGRVLGWRAPIDDPRRRTWFLRDGERYEVVSPPPDLPDSAGMVLLDLNNRGQILGRVQDWPSAMSTSFLREPDGTFEPIAWNHPWPETIAVRMSSGENVTMHLVRAGTNALRLNDRGEILATAQGLYECRLANGGLYRQIEQVHGIARKGGRS